MHGMLEKLSRVLITSTITDVAHSLLHFLSPKINQAARPDRLVAVVGAAAGIRFVATFDLSQTETRELEKYLRDLILKAYQIINAALLLTSSSSL